MDQIYEFSCVIRLKANARRRTNAPSELYPALEAVLPPEWEIREWDYDDDYSILDLYAVFESDEDEEGSSETFEASEVQAALEAAISDLGWTISQEVEAVE